MTSQTACFITFEIVREENAIRVLSTRMNSPRMAQGYGLLTDAERLEAERLITQASDILGEYTHRVLAPDMADNVRLFGATPPPRTKG